MIKLVATSGCAYTRHPAGRITAVTDLAYGPNDARVKRAFAGRTSNVTVSARGVISAIFGLFSSDDDVTKSASKDKSEQNIDRSADIDSNSNSDRSYE